MTKKDEFTFNEQDENVFSNKENKAPDSEKAVHYQLPYTLKLEYPVTLGKDTKTEVVFKNRITLGMTAHIPAGEVGAQKIGHQIPLVAGMTGELPILVKNLDFYDAQKCMEIVTYFLTGSDNDAEDGDTTSD